GGGAAGGGCAGTGGASGGSSPSSTFRNRKLGTYFPRTSRQVVSGHARTSPTGPHRKAQNAVATSWATAERPRLWPYKSGSSTLLHSASSPRYRTTTAKVGPQPSVTVNVNRTGGATPAQAPMEGT